MIVYRLAKAAFTALDGEGARLYGGRWNSPGRPMIYTAASPSLAVLEVLVHFDLPVELMPDDYRLLTIEVPDAAEIEQLEQTPMDLDVRRSAGDDFLVRGAALALLVRSVVVPQERNALINAHHEAMRSVRLVRDEMFRFDRRLLSTTVP